MPKRRLTDAEKTAAVEMARAGAPVNAKVSYKVDDETDENGEPIIRRSRRITERVTPKDRKPG